jgi:hypothetical protein
MDTGDSDGSTHGGTDADEAPPPDGESAIPKKVQKSMKRNTVATKQLVVTRVNPTGEPVSPRKTASKYGNDIGCTVRECCNINDDNLRDSDNPELRTILLWRLH